MTTVSLTVNGGSASEISLDPAGDAVPNMVSGYKDLCVSRMDTMALKDNKQENFHVEVNSALSGVMNNDERKFETEISLLREVIASQLDLIQQQSEQLSIKERYINKLKSENELLSQRLIRMDRRVNLHLSSGSNLNTVNSSGAVSCSGIAVSPTRKRRRDSSPLSGSAVSLHQNSELDPASTNDSRTSRSRPTGNDERRSRIGRHSSSDRWSNSSSRRSHHIRKSGHDKRNNRSKHHLTDSEDGQQSTNRTQGMMSTKELYYTTVGEQECQWGAEPLASAARPLTQLEVPSWRIKPVTGSYTMEGTENLSDDTFEKRHAKHVLEEKRRKRWDYQRIRELRHNERLREREAGRCRAGGAGGAGGPGSGSGIGGRLNGTCNLGEITSLWPQPSGETRLIVNEAVPVAFMGFTLPILPDRDFSYSSYRELDSKVNKYSKRLRR